MGDQGARWLTARQAAELLGIGYRGVLMAIERRRLLATWWGAGNRWLIASDDAARYHATRGPARRRRA